jgi:hypothetical protein
MFRTIVAYFRLPSLKKQDAVLSEKVLDKMDELIEVRQETNAAYDALLDKMKKDRVADKMRQWERDWGEPAPASLVEKWGR